LQEDGRDALVVKLGKEFAEHAGGGPLGFGAPRGEFVEEEVADVFVLVTDEGILAETFDPAVGMGTEAVRIRLSGVKGGELRGLEPEAWDHSIADFGLRIAEFASEGAHRTHARRDLSARITDFGG
jgi:hypothetical protein